MAQKRHLTTASGHFNWLNKIIKKPEIDFTTEIVATNGGFNKLHGPEVNLLIGLGQIYFRTITLKPPTML